MIKQLILALSIMAIYLSWINHQKSVQWTILESDTTIIKKVFRKEKIKSYNLTETDALKTVRIISSDFDSIKVTLHLNQAIKIDDYKFQFIAGLNEKNEKVVFVNGFSIKLPQWIQSKWKTELIVLKCVRDDLIHFKLNLTHSEYSQIAKADCE